MKVKAVIHMHSTYSDGSYSLKDLTEKIDADIICVTDHDKYFTEKKFKKYVDECKKLSTKKKLVIPCLEVGYKNPHMMGLGVNKLVRDVSLKENIKNIQKAGGVAILCHPFGAKDKPVSMKDDFLDDVKGLDGVEIWNLASHGVKIPSSRALKFYGKLKKLNKNLIATAGADIHRVIRQEPYMVVNVKKKTKKDFLDTVRKGNYETKLHEFKITSDGKFFEDSVRVDSRFSFKLKTKINAVFLFLFALPVKIALKVCYFLGLSKETRRKLSWFYSRFFGKVH